MIVAEEIDAALVAILQSLLAGKGTVADVAYHAIRAGGGALATIGYICLEVVTLPVAFCETRRARKLAAAGYTVLRRTTANVT
tara:strand:+ start:584 stop:832 length:249 start_codon:yes stop_codon:yes gene_type:complete